MKEVSEVESKEIVQPRPHTGSAMGLVPATGEGGLTLIEDPAVRVEQVRKVAVILQQIVKEAGCSTKIGPKEHLHIEGWQTIASFFGCVAGTDYSKPMMRDGKVVGYEAKASVWKNGQKISAGAEAICTRDEANWRSRDEYAIKSMAQTRAQSKALASCFRWVAILAKYSGTPAEEMIGLKLPAPWRSMPTRYPGGCQVCGKKFDRGDMIAYNGETKPKGIRCLVENHFDSSSFLLARSPVLRTQIPFPLFKHLLDSFSYYIDCNN